MPCAVAGQDHDEGEGTNLQLLLELPSGNLTVQYGLIWFNIALVGMIMGEEWDTTGILRDIVNITHL